MNSALSNFSFRDLTYILALAEYKHFGQAAQACLVSQPALSKQIKQIETLLGVSLFERDKRNVMVTETGRQVVAQARIILDEGEKMIRLTHQHQQPLSGKYRMGVIASSCPYLLPYFVGDIRDSYPDLRLTIKEGLTDDLVKDLKHGELDWVIAATTFEDDSLTHLPLFFEPFVLAYNPLVGYRFKDKITVSNIDPTQLLLLEDGHCLKDQTVDICKIQESFTQETFKATSLETLLQMTATGIGISVIPKLAVPDPDKFSESLRFSEFSKSTEGRTMAIYTRKTAPFTKESQMMATFIQSRLPDSIVKKI
ncbi:MAG: LysR family transcriptional regulator [Vampirovibrio sp.]|nr:LysR family transcriptional regulator [Vampirovibrio sp.]